MTRARRRPGLHAAGVRLAATGALCWSTLSALGVAATGCTEDAVLVLRRAPAPPDPVLAPPAAAPPFARPRAGDGGPGPLPDAGPMPVDCREVTTTAATVSPDALLWDAGYGLPGIDGPGTAVTDVEVRGDVVYVGGRFEGAGGRAARNVARWTDAGGWARLGDGLPDPVTALAVDPSGRPWAATADQSIPRLARVHAFEDGAWVERGEVRGEVLALEGTGDGVALGGDFDDVAGVPARNLAVWDGRWRAFVDEPIDGPVRALLSTPSGLCIGGDFRRVDGVARLAFACRGQTGWLEDTGLPADAGRVLDLAEGPDDAVYVAGEFDLARAVPGSVGGGLLSWTPEGWTDLGPGFVTAAAAPAPVRAVVAAGTRIVVAGPFDEAVAAPGMPLGGLAEWRPGVGWTPLAGAPTLDDALVSGPDVAGLAVAPDGSPLAWGDLRLGGTDRPTRLAAWNGSEWRIPRSAGLELRGVVGPVAALSGAGACPRLVAGAFPRAGNARVEGLTRLDPLLGHLPLPGRPGGLRAAASTPDGALVAALAPGDALGAVVRSEAGVWVPVGGGVTGDVRALHVAPDGAITLGGDLDALGSGPGAYLARHAPGVGWERFGGGPDGPVRAILVTPDGALVVAGDFTAAGGVDTGPVARWDGARWDPMGLGLVGPVTALARHGDVLVVGRRGDDGGPALLRLEAGGATPLTSTLTGAGVEVRALRSWRGRLFVGGDLPGGLRVVVGDDTVPVAGGVDGVVEALSADPGGLWVGGRFAFAGDVPAANLARLSAD